MGLVSRQRRKDVAHRHNRLCKACSPVVLLSMLSGAFILLFSYADSLSDVKDRIVHQNFLQIPSTREEPFVVQRYTWKCENEKCIKALANNAEEISLSTCNMLCSQPPVWPEPSKISVSDKESTAIDITKISLDLPCQGPAKIMLQNATDLFINSLESAKPGNRATPNGIKLNLNVILSDCAVDKLKLTTDESYKLLTRKDSSVSELFAYISANNFFGARHGLESLSQLIWYDEVEGALKLLHDVSLEDAPKFPHRGLMVDTARNFFPLPQLKKVVDGMAMSKLNVLHLHLTDAASFPIVLPKVQGLAEYGAYGPDMIYTPADIKDLLHYARVRGVRLLLEIDSPSHVNAGWNHAQNDLGQKYVICGENDFFNGHLNPDNQDVLRIVEDIYSDLLELSEDNEMFHIGSDEVNLDCWRTTDTAKALNLKSRNDLLAFWANYTNQMLARLKSANNDNFPNRIIMWSSPLTESQHFKDVNGNITVQLWLGNPRSILEQGHSVIYSMVGHWYLDCGFGPWNPKMGSGTCDPYTPWQKFYKYRPWVEFGFKENVIGGEVCLWTEEVDVDTLETRIWPRAAAFAERVWSDPDDYSDYDVYTRLVSFRERLGMKGIKVAGMWPRWCSQNPGKC